MPVAVLDVNQHAFVSHAVPEAPALQPLVPPELQALEWQVRRDAYDAAVRPLAVPSSAADPPTSPIRQRVNVAPEEQLVPALQTVYATFCADRQVRQRE